MKNNTVIIYIPVLHEGYISFLKKHNPDTIFVLSKEFIVSHESLSYIKKEIRALSTERITTIVSLLFPYATVVPIYHIGDLLPFIHGQTETLIMPDDDISHVIAAHTTFPELITFDSIFLRWDRNNTLQPNQIIPDDTISESIFVRIIKDEAQKSSDWWRQVGAMIVKDGVCIQSTHNVHVPHEHIPYMNGDPRNAFHKGDHIELGTSIHAEAALIGNAAREGIALNGASLYTTTFPCPVCAKLITQAGIKEVFFIEGYSMLDAVDILKHADIKIIQII